MNLCHTFIPIPYVRTAYRSATSRTAAASGALNFSVAASLRSIFPVRSTSVSVLSTHRRTARRSGSRLRQWRIWIIQERDYSNIILTNISMKRTCWQVKILLYGSYKRSTSSSTGEGRRSAVESAPWFKASEQGSSILPFATRVFIIFVIISEIQFSSWLSVRTDICDKASEEVMN